jgi:hypothetical protein
MSYDPKQHPKHPQYQSLADQLEEVDTVNTKLRRRRQWRRGFQVGLVLSAALLAIFLIIYLSTR